MPPRVYFNSSFTVLGWINAGQARKYARVFDCGNGSPGQNVLFYYSNPTTLIPGAYFFYDDGTYNYYLNTNPTALNVNKWQHLALVLDVSVAYIYIDGIQKASRSSLSLPKNEVRSKCFIGKSNWYMNDDLANADFDEIKIFNRALTQQEIISEMNNDFCL